MDKVEGFRNESFEPEEIELYVNKSQMRLIDDLMNKNFQQGTLRYEWLRPFQTSSQSAVIFIGDNSTADVLYPATLYYLIAARANIVLSTTQFSPNGTSDKCLDKIDDPTSITNPVNTIEQIDFEETGTVALKENNVFYGKNYRHPRGEVTGGGMRLYRGEKFIINSVTFDYVTEPPDIDVSSSDALLWPVSANEKIVDYTVEYMRLTIEDPAYTGNVQDFNLRTQNA